MSAGYRDMNVQAAREAPRGSPGVFVGDLPVARRLGDLAVGTRARVRSGGQQPVAALEMTTQVAARVAELAARVCGRRADRSHDLDLRGTQFLRKSAIALDAHEHVVDAGRKLRRARIDEHQFLLDADGEAVRVRERRLARGNG